MQGGVQEGGFGRAYEGGDFGYICFFQAFEALEVLHQFGGSCRPYPFYSI